MSILEHFPLEKPRASQVEVLNAIEAAFDKGYKNVLLEAPVGSGKSAIAIACAKFYGSAHVLTPRKSLQDQYLADFSKESLATMKGRGAYPCTYLTEDNLATYNKVVHKIWNGLPLFVPPGERNCAEGPCLTSKDAKTACTQFDEGEEEYPCPYHVAIDSASGKDIIVHNLHGFIFQTYYSGRFRVRPLLVIDECHEVEGILRGFGEKKFSLPLFIKDEDEPTTDEVTTLEDWSTWLLQFSNLFSKDIKATSVETGNSEKVSPREEFINILESMSSLSESIGTKFVVTLEKDPIAKRSRFIFTPEYVGNLNEKFLLQYGERRLLMSGTIYSKDLYCRLNGLKPEETCFIKIGSSFPKANRPIYLKDQYTVDTSHKMWDENFREMVTNIKTIMSVFHDKKGLIHTPSYHASLVLYNALKDTHRVVIHDKENFQSKLLNFYGSEEPSVFLSPTCQQGVDFKDDRSRFQIILRVPYPNTSDKLMAKKVKEDFPYYNYLALVSFGQQIGRINRSEDDFGVTILMDKRFNSFISRNKNVLPKWLTDAVIYK